MTVKTVIAKPGDPDYDYLKEAVEANKADRAERIVAERVNGKEGA